MRTLILGTAPQTPLDTLYVFAGPWCFAAVPHELDSAGQSPVEPVSEGVELDSKEPDAAEQPSSKPEPGEQSVAPATSELDAPERVTQEPDTPKPAAHAVPAGHLFPAEPFADPDRLDTAVRQARRLLAVAAPFLADRLNAHHHTRLSAVFWDTALAPWLCTAVEILVDRIWRLDALMAEYGETPLRVPLPSSEAPQFTDTRDFMLRGVLDPFWNHWLFARLLEGRIPPAWKPEGLVVELSPPPPAVKESFSRRMARRVLFGLPFPRIKGFTTGQALRLSLSLMANHHTADHAVPLRAFGVTPTGRPPKTPAFSEPDLPNFPPADLPRALQPDLSEQELSEALAEPDTAVPALSVADEVLCAILFDMLPLSLLAPLPAPGPMLARTRVAAVSSADDERLRLRLAWHRERGGRLVYTQHGGEYGYVRSQLAYSAVEYRQEAFISWGWTQHGHANGVPESGPGVPDNAGRIIPLPHPQLEAVRGRHVETAPVLLFVGTEMALIPYNLKSTRRTVQQFAYREDKARFFNALSPKMRERALYRPYFDLPCTLPDFPWMEARFPGLQRCTGPLEPHLFGCRLLVLDHLGTTLAQALAANVPFVILRNPTHQPVTADCQPLLDKLAEAGMLFENPAEAAAQCERVWNNVGQWWNADAARKARNAFSDSHAGGHAQATDLLGQWQDALRKI